MDNPANGQDARPWTHGHPDGPRLDVNRVAWFACDPYPTWYRWGDCGLVIATPHFPKGDGERRPVSANLKPFIDALKDAFDGEVGFLDSNYTDIGDNDASSVVLDGRWDFAAIAYALHAQGLITPAPLRETLNRVQAALDNLAAETEPPCDHITIHQANEKAIHDISIYVSPEEAE